MDLIHLLRRVTVGLDMHGAEFAARNGLHPTDLRALIHLLDAARSGAVVPPGSLGAELGLNSAGTTALIDRLENPGLIRRDRDVNDRRRVLIRVEPAAVTLGTSFFGPLIARVLAVADTFGDDEIAVVTRFLTEVSRTVEDARAAPPARS